MEQDNDKNCGAKPYVHVLLPVHNRRELTGRFLLSLVAQKYQNVRLVAIDDGSIDGTANLIADTFPNAIIIKGNGNWWWAGCLQQGINMLHRQAISDSDIVLILNDDTTFDEDFVECGVRVLEQNRGCVLGSRNVDVHTGRIEETGVSANFVEFKFRQAHSQSEIHCLPTRGLFVYWRDMKRVGNFYPRLLPHYWSDYEYTIRATRKGLRCITHESVVLTPDMSATGHHELDGLIGRDFVKRFFSKKSPLNPWYRMIFVLMAAPGALKFVGVLNVIVRALPRLLLQGVLRKEFPRRVFSRRKI